MSASGGAKQADRPVANINTMMAQYHSSGQHPGVSRHQPLYGDFTRAQDLHDTLNRTIAAQDSYDRLPARVRAASENDPVRFLQMFAEEEGLAVLREAGLVVEDPPVPPEVTEPASSKKEGEPPTPKPAPEEPKKASPTPA